MADRRTLYVRARVRDLFPPGDAIVPSLLRFMAAANDLRTLQKMWLYSNSRVGSTQSEQDIIKAEGNYFFRLTCATVYETAIAFQVLRKVLETTPEHLEKMPDEARAAFHALNNIFPRNFVKKKPYGKTLRKLRNSVFHYDRPIVFRKELEKHDELGNLILGEVVGVSRYLLADDLQVQILSHQLGGQFEEQLGQLMQLILDVTNHFGMLVDGIAYLYVRSREQAIEEQRQDTADLERLWNITAESE